MSLFATCRGSYWPEEIGEEEITREEIHFRRLMLTRIQRLLANIQELAPGITSCAAEIEASRRIPPDLVEALRSIGIFRMFVPQSHGGLELDTPGGLEIFTAISRIDGSVGWTAMIAGAHGIFAPCWRGRPTSRSTRMVPT
jgi:alkylation response protein AidB-like acyl-CoA dehydrogenase